MGQVEAHHAQSALVLATDRDIIAKPKRSPAALKLWLERNFPIVRISAAAATAAIVKTH